MADPARNPIVRTCFDALEAEFAAELAEIPLVRDARSPMAGAEQVRRLDNFSRRCVERVVSAINALMRDLSLAR
jgi:hypothetical protein